MNQINQRVKRIINSIFGFIEVILAFRLIFKLFGANQENEFVKIIYETTEYKQIQFNLETNL